MIKKLFSTAIFCLAMVVVYASNVKVNDIYYDFDDATHTAIVSYRGASYSSFENEYEGDIVIPSTVKHDGKVYDVKAIGLLAFSGCTTLKSVQLPASIVKINGWAFDGCINLQSVTMQEGVESIGSYAFSGNKKLTSIVIPNSVNNVGSYAFQQCESLVEVTIGAKLKMLDNNMFFGDKAIKTITLNSVVPPTFAPNVFDAAVFSAKVSVPCVAKEAYVASAWNKFASIESGRAWQLQVASADAAKGSVQVTKNNTCSDDVVVFAATPAKGFVFVGWNDGNKDNPRSVSLTSDAQFTAQFDAIPAAPVAAVATVPQQVAVVEQKAQEEAAKAQREAERAQAKAEAQRKQDEARAQAQAAEAKRQAEAKQRQAEQKAQEEAAKAQREAERAQAKAEAQRKQDEARAQAQAAEAKRQAEAKQRQAEQKAQEEAAKAQREAERAQAKAEAQRQQAQSQSKDAAQAANAKWTIGKATAVTTATATAATVGALEGSDGKSYTISAKSNNWAAGSVKGAKRYVQGTTAVLTATPRKGYHFTRWEDGSVLNPRTIIVTKDAAYIADFAIDQYEVKLTVDSALNGTTIGDGKYDYRSIVTINAEPNEGYEFVQWSDGKKTNPRSIRIKENVNLQASFAPKKYQIVTSVNGGKKGNGKVTGAGTYSHNDQITLTAVADSGYHFSQWQDGVTTNPRVLSATKNMNFEATFASNQYDLTLKTDDVAKGQVKGAGKYAFKEKATIQAIAEEGYHFEKWNDGNTENPRVITIEKKAEYVASFAVDNYEVKALSKDLSKGTVSGGGKYDFKTMVQLQATPNKGHYFVKWNDDVTENPRTVTVTKPVEYEATFAELIFTVNAQSANSALGRVIGSGSYLFGTNALLRAEAQEGYHFEKWSDGSVDNPRTITVENDLQLTAEFVINTYELRAASDHIDRGIVKGNGKYEYGQVATMTATARQGYHFTQWSDGNTENPRKVTMLANYSISAQFDLDIYHMEAKSAAPEKGKTIGTGDYLYNYTATIRAVANEGYHFDGWNDGIVENPREITMTKDETFEAMFSPNMYVIAVKSADVNKGTVEGSGSFEYLYTPQITATAKYGYHFDHWNDAVKDNPRKLKVESDKTYIAYFEPNVYTLSAKSNDAQFGFVSGAGDYAYNTSAALRAVPATGYRFAKWSDGNTQNPRKVTVTKHEMYEAVFVPISYSLTLTSNDVHKGTVKGSGTYDFQSVAKMEATPKQGYHFVRWSDGNTQNPRNYTIQGNAAYEASFAANSYTLEVKSEDKNNGEAYGTGTFEYNTSVSISAVPAQGYVFVKWSDGNKQNPRSVTITGNQTLTAIFDLDISGR